MEKELLQQRKETIYQFICDELYVPMKAKEIAAVLSVPKEMRKELQEVLDELLAEGQDRSQCKRKIQKERRKISGRNLYGTSREGFGFVSIEGEDADIFIPEKAVNGAFHMDTVQVEVVSETSGETP